MGMIEDLFKEFHREVQFDDSETIAEVFAQVDHHQEQAIFQYAIISLCVAVLALIVSLALDYFSIDSGTTSSLFVIFFGITAVFFLLLFKFGRQVLIGNRLYKKYQEVKCPKCEEFIPFYQWTCPKCKKVHGNRHIFLDCNKCDMKIGKLHKNLQAITCQKCGNDLFFYEPYEGGISEASFRGE